MLHDQVSIPSALAEYWTGIFAGTNVGGRMLHFRHRPKPSTKLFYNGESPLRDANTRIGGGIPCTSVGGDGTGPKV